MPYKLGGKKPQMNNASSIKTNAAMYASKTSMYKPMFTPEGGDNEHLNKKFKAQKSDEAQKTTAEESAKYTGQAKGGRIKSGGGEAMTQQMYNEDSQIKKLGLISKVEAKAGKDWVKNKGSRHSPMGTISETIRKADPNLSDAQVKSLALRMKGHYSRGYHQPTKTAAERRADEATKVAIASRLRKPKGGLTKKQAEAKAMKAVETNYQIRKKKEEAAARTSAKMYGKKKK